MNFDKYKRLTTHMVVNGKNTNTVTNKGKVTLDDLINRLTLLEDLIVCKRLVPKYSIEKSGDWFCVYELCSDCHDYVYETTEETEAKAKLNQLMGVFENES